MNHRLVPDQGTWVSRLSLSPFPSSFLKRNFWEEVAQVFYGSVTLNHYYESSAIKCCFLVAYLMYTLLIVLFFVVVCAKVLKIR